MCIDALTQAELQARVPPGKGRGPGSCPGPQRWLGGAGGTLWEHWGLHRAPWGGQEKQRHSRSGKTARKRQASEKARIMLQGEQVAHRMHQDRSKEEAMVIAGGNTWCSRCGPSGDTDDAELQPREPPLGSLPQIHPSATSDSSRGSAAPRPTRSFHCVGPVVAPDTAVVVRGLKDSLRQNP